VKVEVKRIRAALEAAGDDSRGDLRRRRLHRRHPRGPPGPLLAITPSPHPTSRACFGLLPASSETRSRTCSRLPAQRSVSQRIAEFQDVVSA
jgi:hypothetical protein